EFLEVYDALIQSQIPLGLILDRNRMLIHTMGDIASVLKTTSGIFRGVIDDFLDGAAGTTLNAALIRAQRQPDTSFVLERIQPSQDRPDLYRVQVAALTLNSIQVVGWSIGFESMQMVDTPEGSSQESLRVRVDTSDSTEILESELEFTRESLRASMEEMEASNEELQATNEEMIASNEELQSTNEELQSVNEELHSVNAELNRKVGQLEESKNDLETFFASSNVGTVFLDAMMRIRKFTPAINRHINLLPRDVGRPLTDFTNRLGVANFDVLVKQVISSGDKCSLSGVDDFGEMTVINILPYVTGGVVSGAVFSVVTRAELSEGTTLMRSFDRSGVWEWPDVKSDSMWWSPTCYELLGLEVGSLASMSGFQELLHEEDRWQLSHKGTSRCPFATSGLLRLRLRCANGEFKGFELQGVSEVSEEGTIKSMSGMIAASNHFLLHTSGIPAKHKEYAG
ncbi:MAG: PAS domain-containing protein, partial [Planctomycetota bacterium]